jgi:hypothetical protein
LTSSFAQTEQYPCSSISRLQTSLIRRSCSASGVLVLVVILTTSFRSANSFFSIASRSRSCDW